jgi:hypothetical protein
VAKLQVDTSRGRWEEVLYGESHDSISARGFLGFDIIEAEIPIILANEKA